jgi:hypothetical protein
MMATTLPLVQIRHSVRMITDLFAYGVLAEPLLSLPPLLTAKPTPTLPKTAPNTIHFL